MFITHLLNSLPQAEYEGAILAIKEKLRRGTNDLPEIEQILEDKYQSMKYVKGWDEEEDNYALFASPNNKKGHKNSIREDVAIVESLDTKLRIALTKERERWICLELNATIVENLDILHETAQSPARMLILLKKMSKTGN